MGYMAQWKNEKMGNDRFLEISFIRSQIIRIVLLRLSITS